MERQPPAPGSIGRITIRLDQGNPLPYFEAPTPEQETLLRGIYALLAGEPFPIPDGLLLLEVSSAPAGPWEVAVQQDPNGPDCALPCVAWAHQAKRRINAAPGPDRLLGLAGTLQRLQEEQARIQTLLQAAVPYLYPDDAPAP
jgi:hypothetical protein